MRCVCAPQTKYMPLLIDNAATRLLCLLYVVLRPWPARRAHLPKSINRVHRRHYVCVWLRLTLLFNMLPTLINTTATNNNNNTYKLPNLLVQPQRARALTQTIWRSSVPRTKCFRRRWKRPCTTYRTCRSEAHQRRLWPSCTLANAASSGCALPGETERKRERGKVVWIEGDVRRLEQWA